MNISNSGRWLGKQAKFLLAIALAAVIGGATTAGVMAAIPDTDGKIYACYTTGLLARVKIIDNTTQSCGGSETAINWSQNGSGSPLLANPAGKNLSEAVMVYWDLRNMDFTGTDFTVSKVVSSDFRGSNLTNANFLNSLMTHANLSGLNLNGTNLQGTTLVGASLVGTTFTNVSIFEANLSDQDLSNYNLSGITDFKRSAFARANLNNATLPSNPDLRGIQAWDAILTNLDLSGGNLAGAYLLGADFSGSDLTNVTWSDPSSGGTTCPDGTLASDNGDTCIGHL